jgi:hypothetical protein
VHPHPGHCGRLLLLLHGGGNLFGLVPLHVDGEALAKVRLLGAAVGTRDHLRVVGEEVEPLLGMDHEVVAIVALQKDNTVNC